MRTLEQLIDRTDPGWPLVTSWIACAKNSVDVIAPDRARSERTLVALQVTTRSPMGAVALETGGLLVDRGWVRVLGGGSARFTGSLASWNGLGDAPTRPAIGGAFVIGYDV